MSSLSFADLSRKSSFIFDLDGTLVDSSPSHERAFIETLKEHFPEALERFNYDHYRGESTKQVFRKLGVGRETLLNAMTEQKQFRYRSLANSGRVKSFRFATELIQTLRARGHRCFLATGGSRRSTDAILRALGWSELFEGVVTADDVERSKPDPQIFDKVLKDFGVDPHAAVVIEDASSGVEAARSAGLEVVQIVEPPRAACESANLIFDSLEGLMKALDLEGVK